MAAAPGGGAQLDAQIAQINNNLQLLLPLQQLQQLPQAVAALQVSVEEMQGQLALLVPAGGAGPVPVAALPPGFANVPNVLADLQAAVAALAPPAAGGAVAANAAVAQAAPQLTVRQRISAARSANHHEREDVFVPVVLLDGTNPPHWPANFSRTRLRTMAPAAAQQLLGDYNLSINGGEWALRNRIAKHIGAITF